MPPPPLKRRRFAPDRSPDRAQKMRRCAPCVRCLRCMCGVWFRYATIIRYLTGLSPVDPHGPVVICSFCSGRVTVGASAILFPRFSPPRLLPHDAEIRSFACGLAADARPPVHGPSTPFFPPHYVIVRSGRPRWTGWTCCLSSRARWPVCRSCAMRRQQRAFCRLLARLVVPARTAPGFAHR